MRGILASLIPLAVIVAGLLYCASLSLADVARILGGM